MLRFWRSAVSVCVAALLCLLSLAVTAPAVAQDSKLSEADLRKEIEGSGYPLTIRRAPEQHKIANRYVILFTDTVSDPDGEAGNIVAREGGKVHFTYGHAVKGFAATLSPETVEKLRRDPRIALIEEDRTVHTAWLAPPPFLQAGTIPVPQSPQTPAPSWALDRIDQRNLPLDNSFSFPASAGAGVHLYIIDSGMLGGIFGQAGAHVEYEGRVGDGADFVTPGTNGDDCLGHGTFAASLAGGTTLGVAKLVTFHPVRVINCGDGGTVSGIIAGVNWVTSDHLAHPGQKAVANMSLTVNGVDTALDQAVQTSINAGIVYVIAAGNSGPSAIDPITGLDFANSCNLSPQRVGSAITVGAMQSDGFHPDSQAIFSDFGGCVDLYAPGVQMTGASIASTTAITGPPFDGINHFGTSWSAPLVSGVAATYLAANPNANQSQVVSAIVSNATINVLSLISTANTTQTSVVPNRLLYSDFQTDIQTTVSSSNGSPVADSQFAYTFQVKNSGPYNSMDPVLFTDNLPAAVGSVNVVTSRGTCSGITQISCNLGRLAVGEQATIVVAATAPFTPQSFTNTGTAALQSGQTDRAPANNAATLTLTSH
ncbi:MAG TPA: S8 family serine peptidase [Candidatus Dormibacteraeota bacterium]|jgi:hypothetical protein|nr:S8 family serine peptidase [Candidatus Dormibacteraeota bacterium]